MPIVPESESFRFGNGYINRSRFAIILHVSMVDIPSVMVDNYLPLLSKYISSELGLVIDISKYTILSTRYGVKFFGISMSKGGYYILKIYNLTEFQKVLEYGNFEILPRKYGMTIFK